MIDLLKHNSKYENNQIKCLDHGFIRLVDIMPRVSEDDEITTGDFAIVQAARVSYGKGTKSVREDRGLIRYLMRNWHTSPLEQVELKFHCKMPIFVARQWVRHRTANINEYSGRYSEMSSEFYLPEGDRIQTQSITNKQGSSGESLDVLVASRIIDEMETLNENAYSEYKKLIEAGVSRELSRVLLPVSNYTEWYWKIDLLNLFKFLKLRMDSHAQYEIQVYAEAIFALIKDLFPLSCEAFEDYWLNGVNFSAEQLKWIQHILKTSNSEVEKQLNIDLINEKSEMSKSEKEDLIKKIYK